MVLILVPGLFHVRMFPYSCHLLQRTKQTQLSPQKESVYSRAKSDLPRSGKRRAWLLQVPCSHVEATL